MRYRHLYYDYADYIPLPEHPAKSARPRDIASLYVHKAERQNLDAIRSQHGVTEIVGVTPLPIIPAMQVEVLCQDSDTAFALMDAWSAYSETSPHRPHSQGDAIEWGKQFRPYGHIPTDWRF
jgi:hypothetical protein